jgi:hypothetical protein
MVRKTIELMRGVVLPTILLAALIVQDTALARGPGSGSGGSGSSGGASSGGGSGALSRSVIERNNPQTDVDPQPAAARAAEAAISVCSVDDPRCIADALDAYAAALRKLPLPPALKNLPDIVSRAANQVRAAKTHAQAVHAIKAAIAEVHKTIALLKADDPVVFKAETRSGALVAETLEVADHKLEKAIGL